MTQRMKAYAFVKGDAVLLQVLEVKYVHELEPIKLGDDVFAFSPITLGRLLQFPTGALRLYGKLIAYPKIHGRELPYDLSPSHIGPSAVAKQLKSPYVEYIWRGGATGYEIAFAGWPDGTERIYCDLHANRRVESWRFWEKPVFVPNPGTRFIVSESGITPLENLPLVEACNDVGWHIAEDQLSRFESGG